jgi:hypothetical protein
MKRRLALAVLGAGLLITSVAGAQMVRGNYNEPAFELLRSERPFELRRYAPRIVAETTVQGRTASDATSKGFSRLANYIFGGNRAKDGSSTKIAMTTPVESVPKTDSTFTVTFTMPSHFTMSSLPSPNDASVSLRELPTQTVATARFSGVARSQDLATLKGELLSFVQAQGYQVTSSITIAQYDPPWTPGPLRRNELMVSVTAKGGSEGTNAAEQ